MVWKDLPGLAREEWISKYPLHILLAEDDANTRMSLALTLRRAGHQVILAENANVLLFILETMSEKDRKQVDLLVTDLMMPGKKGEELIRQLDGQGHSWPVVVITAFGYAGLEDEFRRRGNVTLLRKPFHPNELVAAVEQAWANIKQNETPDEPKHTHKEDPA
jgi:DNA-binding response OmpR family regulator